MSAAGPRAAVDQDERATLGHAARKLREEVAKRIVGQETVVEEILMAILAGGHVLLVGVPGLAKTLLIRSVAEAMRLDFRRIQFTPDLVPSDITGTEIMEEDSATGARRFRFVRGPIFANIVLADEINRTPPRTQAALLEAMQEHSVTAAGETMRLPEPFFVLATQNPIEQEGTYPLPEAQLDRFLFDVRIGYPAEDEEVSILRATTGSAAVALTPVLDASHAMGLQRLDARDSGGGAGVALRGAAGACDASGQSGCAGDREALRAMGRGAARRTVADSRREGARAARGAIRGGAGRHQACRAPRAAASRAPELRGGSGRDHRGAGDRRDSVAHLAAAERHRAVACRPREAMEDCSTRCAG